MVNQWSLSGRILLFLFQSRCGTCNWTRVLLYFLYTYKRHKWTWRNVNFVFATSKHRVSMLASFLHHPAHFPGDVYLHLSPSANFVVVFVVGRGTYIRFEMCYLYTHWWYSKNRASHWAMQLFTRSPLSEILAAWGARESYQNMLRIWTKGHWWYAWGARIKFFIYSRNSK